LCFWPPCLKRTISQWDAIAKSKNAATAQYFVHFLKKKGLKYGSGRPQHRQRAMLFALPHKFSDHQRQPVSNDAKLDRKKDKPQIAGQRLDRSNVHD
jgi:hypothetical protein